MSSENILVVDVGGNNVKLRHSDHDERRKFKSGKSMTPQLMVDGVMALIGDWKVDRITIGCPGPVVENRLTLEPVNLSPGWVGFDFAKAFDMPVKVINDAAMQAIGSYEGGKMLFLGLGTGLGTAMVVDNIVLPLELAHLPYRDDATFEDHIGKRGLERLGLKRWQKTVEDVVARFRDAVLVDYVMLGGGNVKKLQKLPEHCRRGSNENAFAGGFRVWREPIVIR